MGVLRCAAFLFVSLLSLAVQAQVANEPQAQVPNEQQPQAANEPQAPVPNEPQAQVPNDPRPQVAHEPGKPSQPPRWWDPGNWPIIPVPEIDVDPNSGTTLGIIPTRLLTDDQGNIERIIAPDIIYNPNFGWGMRARIFAYPSLDTQWYVVGGAKQKVESEFDARFETGRLRQDRWSFIFQAAYDRSGTPRFYGIGNESPIFDQTVYTEQQKFLHLYSGYNLSHKWQLGYTLLPREVEVLPGRLKGIPAITARFVGLLGIGTNRYVLNRISLTYNTLDDLTIPTRGLAVVTYAGLASRHGMFNDSLYSEAGIDTRYYWSPSETLTWAAHASLQYLPTAHRTPFWALNSVGGERSVIGGPQPLRGFGTSRFYDRNSFSASLEMRWQVLSLDALSTHLDFQVTPFLDVGRVFHYPSGVFPLKELHPVYGVGIRGIARPSVVGYVDIGKGGEGVAVFTGINYPF